MNGKALFATVRDDQPGLRDLPGGPLTAAQPSHVDDIRAARFDAYRARIAANRERAATARAGEADPAAAEIARRGRAAVGEALRHHRTRVLQ
jgi:hypothetical protein